MYIFRRNRDASPCDADSTWRGRMPEKRFQCDKERSPPPCCVETKASTWREGVHLFSSRQKGFNVRRRDPCHVEREGLNVMRRVAPSSSRRKRLQRGEVRTPPRCVEKIDATWQGGKNPSLLRQNTPTQAAFRRLKSQYVSWNNIA